jgi:tRNA-uridine 2-sulfurtransferase
MSQRERVVIAMSGGVDSSVAAALLLQAGYEVIGMMLRLWSESGREDDNRCCTPDAMAQARRVAAILGFPFYAIDAQEVFHDKVVNYFIESYRQGDTPNPCLVCNRQVRWEFLLERALALGANYLATGHYVRLGQNSQNQYQILRAVDPDKDQSYVLHILNQDKLTHAKFPLGNYRKTVIRQLAQDFGLPVAQRPDSQDLCFLGADDYRSFLIRNAPNTHHPGPILTQAGDRLGEHQGLAFYTIGQRKGLGISSPRPLYVIQKDLNRNALIVGQADELGRQELIATKTNWISGKTPENPFRAQVKIRYKANLAWGLVTPLENQSIHIAFDEPLRDITAGQAAVIYDDEICLGGGIIRAMDD